MTDVFERTNRGFIALDGNEWRSFLQGLLTCNVENSGSDAFDNTSLGYGYLLSVRSRIIADVFIYPRASGDGCVLSCDRSLRDTVLKLLRRYKLRRAVELSTPSFVEISSRIPLQHWGGRDPRHPRLGYRYVSDASLVIPFDGDAQQNVINDRLGLGILEGAEYGDEKIFPLECGAPYIHALSLTKGCYIGQELVTRTLRTGEVRNFIVPGVCSRPSGSIVSGMEVTFHAKKVGTVMFCSGDLCIMRLKYHEVPLSSETTVVIGDHHFANLIIPETLHAHLNRSQ